MVASFPGWSKNDPFTRAIATTGPANREFTNPTRLGTPPAYHPRRADGPLLFPPVNGFDLDHMPDRDGAHRFDPLHFIFLDTSGFKMRNTGNLSARFQTFKILAFSPLPG